MSEWKKNDVVVHGRDGVCRISETIEMTVGDEVHPYYVLRPVYDKSGKIYVPADRESTGMRAPLTKDEVNELIDEIPDLDSKWIDNEKLRQKEFSRVIGGGAGGDLLTVINSLFEKRTERQKAGRKFHASDERLLSEAEKMLNGEFAFVLGLTPDDVPGYIKNRLKETKKTA